MWCSSFAASFFSRNFAEKIKIASMTTSTTIIVLIIAALVGAVLGYILAAQQARVLKAEGKFKDQQRAEQQQYYERQLAELREAQEVRTAEQQSVHDRQLLDLQTLHARQLADLKGSYEQQLEEIKGARDKQLAEQQQRHDRQLADLKATHEQQLAQQVEVLREQMRTATEQIKTVSEDVLRRRSEDLSAANVQQLGTILQPLKTSLADMRQQVERVDRDQTERVARLDETIKATLSQTAAVGQSADRLATALTSNNKQQGNFGELRLQTLLENLGFQTPLQYEAQVTLTDDTGATLHAADTGQRLVPDFVIHFPEGRDLIIDSKMSLTAFADYFDAEDDAVRAEALSRHVRSVRDHVDELAAKRYQDYIHGARETVDFVVMYVPNDSALQLALGADVHLWEDAAKKGVLITGSHNLYMLLRIVNMSWERFRQGENVQRIMEQANAIISRVQTFYTRLLDVDAQFQKTRDALDGLKSITADHGQSIITSANNLLRLGAKEDKSNPKRKKLLPKGDENAQIVEKEC